MEGDLEDGVAGTMQGWLVSMPTRCPVSTEGDSKQTPNCGEARIVNASMMGPKVSMR